MSIQSMTGFGKATIETDNMTITTEIKSLNSKSFDLSVRLPYYFKEKELELRNELQKLLERGKVDVFVNIEMKEVQAPLKINAELAKHYYSQIKKLSEELNDAQTNIMAEVLKLPEILKSERKEVNEQDWLKIKETCFSAIESLNKFRSDEGKSIEGDFTRQVNSIAAKLEEIKQVDTERINNIKNRIRKNLFDVISKEQIDENRFEQELIYYIEKIDINEEKVRLATHCDYFLKTIQEKASGRKLNFIAQEIGREINTIGSKANDAQIQRLVVEMKDELEKIKEQTNNVL